MPPSNFPPDLPPRPEPVNAVVVAIASVAYIGFAAYKRGTGLVEWFG